MDKSRITAAIWPWGTNTREEMEKAAKEVHEIGYETFESVKAAIYAYDMNLAAYKEVLNRYELKPVSFYFHLPEVEKTESFFATLDKELEFIAALGVERICLQATKGRPQEMTLANKQWELEALVRVAEKSKKFGIMSNLHPHYNTWVMYQDEIEYILDNLDEKLISFAPDTAHLTVGKCDPVEIIKKYVHRVNFTHFKDIKDADAQSAGMASAGMEVYDNFCELGTGKVDFRSVFDILKAANYSGPLCEELDRAPISNAESAKNNFYYLLNNY